MTADPLPSWRAGATKDALLGLLGRIDDVDPARRVAAFDNDGTLWCEKPNYLQLDFFVAQLHEEVARRPALGDRPEYRAVLDGDRQAIGDLGIVRIAGALVELFDGAAPEAFDERVRAFFASARHPSGRPYCDMTYRPMLELLDALRAAGVVPFIVSGGGSEFVRAVG